MDLLGALGEWKAMVGGALAGGKEEKFSGAFDFDEEQVELLKFTGTISLVGFTLFMVLRFVFLRHLSADFSNRCVSILHNFVALAYSVYLVNWSDPFADVGRASTPLEAKALAISLGYFSYDFLVCLFIEDDITAHLHHVVSISGLVLGSIYKRGGYELIVCMVMAESTGPMMHLNYLFKELKHTGSHVTANKTAFSVIFFVARILFGPVLVYHTVRSPTSPILVKLSGVALEVVSVFWFYKLVKIFIYKMRGGKQAKKD
ncbi:TLC domain-containing protein [Chloropicon primus]|uniref:TLC domain-containing protein n=1 Tax=Chloropicon primus TaxID=1764295 RepID=A0A5B8MNS1_9CHLO|nr:hypothetical protein A3770_07p46910 [Chloropicon primus]UPR01391.1 TLC domain-containing protein [Chloropicon primus]|eukprot:QDZ22173.1 hypothetical protein A3770_07p46910 [Chloropicon primus]